MLNVKKLSAAVLAAAQQAAEHSSYQTGLILTLTQLTSHAQGGTSSIHSIPWLASLGAAGVACAAGAIAAWARHIPFSAFETGAERSLHEEPARRQVDHLHSSNQKFHSIWH